ncbi:MAG TPA: hypothetical protein DIW77_00845 [Chromatiaceae bacterium]|nr:hypothetical protein [Chromatiaceae bacterium]
MRPILPASAFSLSVLESPLITSSQMFIGAIQLGEQIYATVLHTDVFESFRSASILRATWKCT